MSRALALLLGGAILGACAQGPEPNALVCTTSDTRTVLRPTGGGTRLRPSINVHSAAHWYIGDSQYIQRPGEFCRLEYVPL